jgi:hypothetical protein
MLHYNNGASERKTDDAITADGGADLAVLVIASRFNLAPSLARVIVECAGLGGCGDRRSGSGGRST